MAKIKKTDYTSVDELGELILYIAGGSTVWYHHSGKNVSQDVLLSVITDKEGGPQKIQPTVRGLTASKLWAWDLNADLPDLQTWAPPLTLGSLLHFPATSWSK